MHVNYKLALAKTICQRLNKGTLPSSYAEIIPCATETVDLQHPLREFKVEWGHSAPRKLVGQVFRELDIFRH